MFFKNLLFTCIIVGGFFGVVELALALAGVRPLLLTEDPLVGFAENIPQFVSSKRPDGTEMMVTAKNKLSHFNYQEFPRHKGDNSYRIFCLGGSTTFGRPYADGVSFCGWLRAYLQAADPSRQWEVINAGGVSYASYRVARLMGELKDYQPDLFIVYSGQNEFLEQRSYEALQKLPAWVINLDATLSSTRVYSAMKLAIDAVKPGSNKASGQRGRLKGEVDEILNHTLGPSSYRRDEALKQQVVAHYRLNMRRMAMIAHSVDADIVFVKPAINIRDMSPFKSLHREDIEYAQLMQWEALFNSARKLQAAGNHGAALDTYRRALLIDDRYAELHYRIGQALFALHRYAGAETAFRRAVEEDVAPLRILASMQQVVEDVAAAMDAPLIDFSEVIRKAYLREYGHAVFGSEYFPDHVHTNIEGYRLLALALFDDLVERGIARPDDTWNEARVEAVRQHIVAGIDPADVAYTLMNLGKVFDWAGKFEEAHNVLLKVLEMSGPSAEIYVRLAVSSYTLGRLDESIHYYRETQALEPERLGINTKLAMILSEQGKTGEAIDYCRAELELYPMNRVAHVCLGKLFGEKGEIDAARKYFDSALQLDPDYDFARVTFAYFLIAQQQYDEALEHCEAALRINPAQHEAHNAIGLIMNKQGKFEQARFHFSEAVRLNPGYADAKINLQQLQAVYGGSVVSVSPQDI